MHLNLKVVTVLFFATFAVAAPADVISPDHQVDARKINPIKIFKDIIHDIKSIF